MGVIVLLINLMRLRGIQSARALEDLMIITANQRVDPTVKTPVESGKVQGTAGHP